MSNILERIVQISDLESITISKIEQKIGASKGVLYKAIQKKTDIQSKWIVLIVENFPQYNPEWLLTGKGEKLRGNNQNTQPVATGLNESAIENFENKINIMSVKIDEIHRAIFRAEAEKELAGLKGDIAKIEKNGKKKSTKE